MFGRFFIFAVCLHLSNAESSEKHIRLLNHIQAVGDTLKLDNVVIQAISKDSNIVLTENPNKVTDALKKYLAVLLLLDEKEINTYVNSLERILPRIQQSDTIKEFIDNLKVMVRKKVLKFNMVLWWIILNSDKKMEKRVLDVTTGVRFENELIEKYLRMLKQFRMHELSYVEEETIKTFEGIRVPYNAMLIEASKEFNKYVTKSISGKNEKDYNLLHQARLNRHMLTDFLTEVFELLIKADVFKVINLCSIFDMEIRMYNYKGSSFEEVLTNPETKTAFDNFIKNNCEHSIVKSRMSAALSGFQDINESFKETPFYKLVGVLDSTYTMTHQKQLEHMQKQLELYLSDDVDIQTYLMQTLRLLLFDHVTAMTTDMKKTIADILRVKTNAVKATTVTGNTVEVNNNTGNVTLSKRRSSQCNETEIGTKKRRRHKNKLRKKKKNREKKDKAKDIPNEEVPNVALNLVKRSIDGTQSNQTTLDDSLGDRKKRKHKKRKLDKHKKRRRMKNKKDKNSEDC